MKTQLIILEQGNILVSDEEIKEGYFYHPKGVIFPVTDAYIKGPISSGIMKKLIASDNPKHNLPSIDYNGLEEQFGIVDVERMAMEAVLCNGGFLQTEDDTEIAYSYYLQGFKATQSLNDKKFSLEDIKPLQDLVDDSYDPYDSTHHLQVQKMLEVITNFIQSLQQPKVFSVEVEMETVKILTNGYKNQPYNIIGFVAAYDYVTQPKITNNQIKIVKIN